MPKVMTPRHETLARKEGPRSVDAVALLPLGSPRRRRRPPLASPSLASRAATAMLAAAFSLAQNTPVARDRSVFYHGYECVIASPDADEWNVTPRGRLISAPEGKIFRLRRGFHPASASLPGFREMNKELIGQFGWSSATMAVQRAHSDGWDLIWTANSLDQEGQIYEARTDAVTQTSGDSYSMDFHGARMLACRPVPGHSVPRDEL